MDCDITMPLSLKTIGSADYRDQSVGLDGCSSQPRGDRGATMEKGEVQIFSLITTIISFLSRNGSVR